MACDNDELLHLSQEEPLKLDPSVLPPQMRIPSSLTKQKSSPVKSIDYHADSSQVSQPIGRSYCQCPPAKAFYGQPGLLQFAIY